MTICFQTKTTGAVTTRHIPRAFFPGLTFLPQLYVYRTSEPESFFYVNYDMRTLHQYNYANVKLFSFISFDCLLCYPFVISICSDTSNIPQTLPPKSQHATPQSS